MSRWAHTANESIHCANGYCYLVLITKGSIRQLNGEYHRLSLALYRQTHRLTSDGSGTKQKSLLFRLSLCYSLCWAGQWANVLSSWLSSDIQSVASCGIQWVWSTSECRQLRVSLLCLKTERTAGDSSHFPLKASKHLLDWSPCQWYL